MSFANIIGSLVCAAALSADSFSNQSIHHIPKRQAHNKAFCNKNLCRMPRFAEAC